MASTNLDRLLAADRAAAPHLRDEELRQLADVSESFASAVQSEGLVISMRPRRSPITGEPEPSEREVAAARRRNLQRAFQARREALANTMTVSEVAEILAVGRQAVLDRVRAGTLLALKEQRRVRLPDWQFDPDGPNGVIDGLPQVLRELRRQPLGELARVRWFVMPKPALDRRTPAAALAEGRIDDVLAQARTVGA